MDLINREDLLSDLTESVVFTARCNDSAEMRGARKIIERIESAPTIDAVPVVHGRWEKSQHNGYLVCSSCRDVYVDNDWVDGKKWNYCPNCGAKMDKDGDE